LWASLCGLSFSYKDLGASTKSKLIGCQYVVKPSPSHFISCRESKTSPPFRWSDFKPSLSEGICIATRSHSAILSSIRVNSSWPECEYFSQSSLVFPLHFSTDIILSTPLIPFLLRNIALKYNMSTSGSNVPRSSANTQCPSMGQRSLTLLNFVKGPNPPGSAIPDQSCYACGEGDRPGEPVMTEYVSVGGRKSSAIHVDYLLM